MITRYALFEGRLRDGSTAAFRQAITDEVLPLWRRFPGATAVRLGFGDSHDPGAPEYPLILAVSFPDAATLERALAGPVRGESRTATESVLARYFTGRVHHHVTTALDAGPARAPLESAPAPA